MASGCTQCETLPNATPWTLVRCHRLMKSNEAPNSIELAFMRPVMSKISARLTSIGDERARLKARLDHLDAEQADLSEYQTLHAPIVAPIRRIPPEVLNEIFSWTLPSIHELKGNVSDLGQPWRRICVSNPSFWSLVVATYRSFQAREHPSRAMIQTQVQRARNLQIHFFGAEDEAAHTQAQVKLFKILSTHSARWVELNITLTKALAPHVAALRGRLPVLRKIWTHWDSEYDIDFSANAADPLGSCFQTAPSLVDAGGQWHDIPMRFPAHQLTAYRAESPWWMHEGVLNTATNLVEARICTDSASEQVPPASHDTQVITMPHLRRLVVNRSSMLGYLRAPVLSEIGFVVEKEDPRPDLDAFVTRSSCAPWRLYLEGLPGADITEDILRKRASIASLRLVFTLSDDTPFEDSDLSDAVVAHLTMLTHGTAPPVSPNLTEISLGAQLSFPIDYPLFLKMLESRRNPRYALRSAAFLTGYWGPDPDPVTAERLALLGKTELSLLVESGRDAGNRMEVWSGASPSAWS
ncbi:hypothetical protein FB45DRAFT_926238 [Roridomyces roridus]|uniref:F-box domain-containing protein n=1 Tax=Roridomyces roridus TaxID=1738132 RepID=A0AAD7FH46_9AGAR|nr:hypothetical protein FB45DRAFT_926238 [Roridomyces roridus]